MGTFTENEKIIISMDLISRQDAIDAINKAFERVFAWDGTSPLGDKVLENVPSARPEITLESAIDYLHSIGWMQEHDRILTESAQPEQRWIPCSERLPQNEKKTYWVCTDTGYQCECRWTNVNHFWTDLITDWHWHIMDIPRYTEVVAWMPLPEPWRGTG